MTKSPTYQLIAFDLDGTLLNDAQTIHSDVAAAIRNVADSVTVLLVTGRHHTAAKPYHDLLGLTTPIICCNGAYLYDYHSEKVLAENAIPTTDALEFLQQSKAHGLNAVVYIADAMIHDANSPVDYMLKMERWASQFPADKRPRIYRSASLIEDITPSPYVWKFVLEGDVASLKNFAQLPFIRAHFVGEQSWHNRIDFARRGNSKGARLEAYYTSLGLTKSQVIAIGDNHNDISMFQVAGLAVAMQNADESVKHAAHEICVTDNNGVGLASLICEKIGK